MDKRQRQLDLAHRIGPGTTLHKVLIVVESGMENKSGRNFSISESGNFLGYSSTAKGAMDNWRQQQDFSHQLGPEIPFHRVLIVVESGGRGGRINGVIFNIRNWERFRL